MKKKYQIFELNEEQVHREPSEYKFKEPKELYLMGWHDTLEETEQAIAKYGDDYINYIILPIYRTDRN